MTETRCGRWDVLLVLAAIAGVTLAAQTGQEAPHWAYGYMKPPAAGESAPPCPPTARPFPDCAYPVTPTAEDGVKRTLPGSSKSFTRNEAHFDYGPGRLVSRGPSVDARHRGQRPTG